jgi:hypothetical protein
MGHRIAERASRTGRDGKTMRYTDFAELVLLTAF